MNLDPANITLLVLCGGQGTRMGGRDKPLLTWQGRAMVDHVLASVPEEMPRLISANRNLQTYKARAPVITDAGIPGRGPLVGIMAGLVHCTTDWLMVAPGDAPDLPEDWWRVLAETANRNSHHAVLHDGSRQQHLHLILQKQKCADVLQQYLTDGHYQVYRWLEAVRPETAQVQHPLRNFNRPEDMQEQTAPDNTD